jgi:hypothetical protein
MQPQNTNDIESILHPPHLIDTNTPQENALKNELKRHITAFINELSIEEVISLYFSLKNKEGIKEVLANHSNPMLKDLNCYVVLEWQKILNKSNSYLFKKGSTIQGELRAYIWMLGLYNE